MQPDPHGTLQRFQASMAIDHEKWHEGTGYDLSLLDAASPSDLAAIESLLVSRGVQDWRDAEALAALGTPRATAALRDALPSATPEIRAAIFRHAPGIADDATRTTSLVAALASAEFYGGLSQTLDEVADFHPPEVIAALFRGTILRGGDVATHFAAMLFHLHGKSDDPFDWDHRPLFLRFNTDIPEERHAALADLRALIAASPKGNRPSPPA